MKRILSLSILISLPMIMNAMEAALQLGRLTESNVEKFMFEQHPEQRDPGSLYNRFKEIQGAENIAGLNSLVKADNTDKNRSVAAYIFGRNLFNWGLTGGYMGKVEAIADLQELFDTITSDTITDMKAVGSMANPLILNMLVMQKGNRTDSDVYNALRTMYQKLEQTYPDKVAEMARSRKFTL